MRAQTQEKIWKVMRGTAEFTTEDIVRLTGEKYSSVSAYLCALVRARYVRCVGIRKQGGGFAVGSPGRLKVWKLVKNTGPKPPQQRRCLYDPNIDDLVEIRDSVDSSLVTRHSSRASGGGDHVD